MFNKRFWTIDLTLPKPDDREKAQKLLDIVRPAIKHLEDCQAQATVNADLLDYFLFGAKRIELIGQRMLDRLDAIDAYEAVFKLSATEADAKLAEVEQTIRKLQGAHESLGKQFAELWARENKPYALDWTMWKFQNVANTYKHIAENIATARQDVEKGRTFPSLVEIGLVQIESKQ